MRQSVLNHNRFVFMPKWPQSQVIKTLPPLESGDVLGKLSSCSSTNVLYADPHKARWDLKVLESLQVQRPLHVLFECPAHDRERFEIEKEIGKEMKVEKAYDLI